MKKAKAPKAITKSRANVDLNERIEAAVKSGNVTMLLEEAQDQKMQEQVAYGLIKWAKTQGHGIDDCLAVLMAAVNHVVPSSPAMAAIHVLAKRYGKALGIIEDYARQHVVNTALKANVKTENGNGVEHTFVDGGGNQFAYKMHKKSTKPTAANVQKMLVSKNLDLAKYMQQTISYSVDEVKLAQLIEEKLVTTEELEACAPEVTWVVKEPQITNANNIALADVPLPSERSAVPRSLVENQ